MNATATEALVAYILASKASKADVAHRAAEYALARRRHADACRRYREAAAETPPEVYEAWCPVRGEPYTRVFYPEPLRQARAWRRMMWRDLLAERRFLQATEQARRASTLANRRDATL